MNKINAKPSDANADSSIIRAKADEANRKRKARRAEQARAAQEAKWEEENRAAEQAQARQAQARQAEARQAEARQAQAEQAQARQAEEEAAQARQAQAEQAEEPKATKTGNLGNKIKVLVDGTEFGNLSAAMAFIDPKQFAKRNDFRDSEWTKINRQLKKSGACMYRGFKIEAV